MFHLNRNGAILLLHVGDYIVCSSIVEFFDNLSCVNTHLLVALSTGNEAPVVRTNITGLQVIYITSLATYYAQNITDSYCTNKVLRNHN